MSDTEVGVGVVEVPTHIIIHTQTKEEVWAMPVRVVEVSAHEEVGWRVEYKKNIQKHVIKEEM